MTAELGSLLGARFALHVPRTRVSYGTYQGHTTFRTVPDGGSTAIRYGWREALATVRIERKCNNRVVVTACSRQRTFG